MARDIYSLQLHYKIGPQPGMNVLHFAEDTESSANPDVGAQGCMAAFDTQIKTIWLACLPDDVELIGYKARRVNNGGGPGVVQPITAEAGTRTGGFSAGAIGPCMIWSYQKLAGGWAAGRTFLPGVSEDDIQENSFDAALITACQAVIAQFLTIPAMTTMMPPLNFEFGIYSPTADSFSGAESGYVSGKPGVQNRRMKPTF